MGAKVNQHKEKPATRINGTGNSCKSGGALQATTHGNLLQQKQVGAIETSSLLTLQQKKLDAMFGNTAQCLEEPEEELTQKKAVQRLPDEEEELPSQGKFINQATVQMQLEEDEELPGQGKFIAQPTAQMLEEDEEEPSQLKANPVQRQENNTGMPDDVKTKMESSFNTDFSGVKVHPGSSKAPEVGALAYTQGHDVHFAPGQFKPESSAGQQLLGHELAHVVQQREGRVKPTTEIAGMPVNDNPSLESEADSLGAKASR